MRTLICGSLAYDTIMVFHDRFRHHILPDQIHILNVAFLVPDMRREYGGCAGNIAYNLQLLGGDPLIMATVGDDADLYLRRLHILGLATDHVRRIEGSFTAQAFITTDLDDNQITAFHPGAMNHSHLNRIADTQGVELAIVAPDGRQGMLEHARDLVAAGIPFVFDPGQGITMFSGEELLDFLRLADWCTVNDYEARLLVERCGRPIESLAREVKALVITLGAQGCVVHVGGKTIEVAAVPADTIFDPTGCGDAFRAGLLYGLAHGWPWLKTARLATLMGSIKIAHRGGQNHKPTRAEIAERYRRAFGETL